MTITIHKFSTPVGELFDEIDLMMPTDAEILSVSNQNENLCIWAIVKTDKPMTRRNFRVAGTGHPLRIPVHRPCPTKEQFLGTAMFADGRLVLHVFDLGEW